MEVLDNGTPPQVKQVLADTAIAGAPPLPASDMGQHMLYHDALAQLGTPQRGQLPLSQLPEQSLIRVDGDTAPVDTGRTALVQRAGCTGGCRKVDHPTGFKG